jgi:hypothetical protein
MVACTLMAGMEIVVGPAGLAGGGEGGPSRPIDSAHASSSYPIHNSSPQRDQRGDRTPRGRTVPRWDVRPWCMSSDLDQLISLSILTALR